MLHVARWTNILQITRRVVYVAVSGDQITIDSSQNNVRIAKRDCILKTRVLSVAKCF